MNIGSNQINVWPFYCRGLGSEIYLLLFSTTRATSASEPVSAQSHGKMMGHILDCFFVEIGCNEVICSVRSPSCTSCDRLRFERYMSVVYLGEGLHTTPTICLAHTLESRHISSIHTIAAEESSMS